MNISSDLVRRLYRLFYAYGLCLSVDLWRQMAATALDLEGLLRFTESDLGHTQGDLPRVLPSEIISMDVSIDAPVKTESGVLCTTIKTSGFVRGLFALTGELWSHSRVGCIE